MIAVSRRAPAEFRSKPTRDYISYSALSTYQQCPLRYYFRYVEGLAEETVSASLAFGSAIHSAVELHFHELLVSGTAPSLDTSVEAYEASWQALPEVDWLNLARRRPGPASFSLASGRPEIDFTW